MLDASNAKIYDAWATNESCLREFIVANLLATSSRAVSKVIKNFH